MSKTTTNYNLIKPELTDVADITAMNPNWDKIDEELKNNKTYTDQKFSSIPTPDVSGQINTHNSDTSAHTNIRGVAGGVATLGSDGKVPNSQLPEISSVKSATVTLTASGWSEGSDERYYQTVSVAGVTADTPVITVDVDLSTTDADAKIAYLEAWSLPSANEVTQGNGTLTFYAWEIPTVNIPVNVGVM